ncbi:hypothetical protein RJT34_22821 [Clitoria ternatea]|uniref:Uncharacterized protein n=1 Tax=Clitoria ternatea TaxID=43366 RepID=A0AAN9FLD9_CLITE
MHSSSIPLSPNEALPSLSASSKFFYPSSSRLDTLRSLCFWYHIGIGGTREWFDGGGEHVGDFGSDIGAETQQDEASECRSSEDFGKVIGRDEFGGYSGGKVSGNDVVDKGKEEEGCMAAILNKVMKVSSVVMEHAVTTFVLWL